VQKPWIVLKFGGTSVAHAERWDRVAERARELGDRYRVWIVVSALAGVSDDLAQAIQDAADGRRSGAARRIRQRHETLADELDLESSTREPVDRLLRCLESWLKGIRLTGEASPRLRAEIMAVGELASTHLGLCALKRRGVQAIRLDARDLLQSRNTPSDTDHSRFLEAQIDVARDPRRADQLAGGSDVVLTQGFIAKTHDGETCLLGRGGSDTSGALFAALLGADELEIWTDVHGMFTADPRLVPVARLIRRVGYREAQELAALGAKVLHPRCLAPLRSSRIPLSIHSTVDPDTEGTRIEATEEEHPAVTAVTCRSGVTLLSLSSLEMWGKSGFLARVFAPFEELGVSIDLVATSQSSISMTLDELPGVTRGLTFRRLLDRLQPMGEVKVIHPCSVVSIVGRRIRSALHELGPAMSVFQERPVHLVSDSAEDLNLSFVVDEEDAQTLVTRLHGHLFGAQGRGPRFGQTWEMLTGRERAQTGGETWWKRRSEQLISLVADGQARYVYHLPGVETRARELVDKLPSIDRVFYSMKANAHTRVLETAVEAGLGIECVSAAEVKLASKISGGRVPILFTPNFCPLDEYGEAFRAGAEVVVDGPEALLARPDLFAGREIGLRIDPGRGLGHHEKVRTAGGGAKFGQPLEDAGQIVDAAREAGAKVVGLHAHVGSGILDPEAWAATGRALSTIVPKFADLRWIDLGGGLGVSERPGHPPLRIDDVERSLAGLRDELPGLQLRLEPGRYLVSEAGVLVVPVTQVRSKAGIRFAGVATGMNSLIRPALYGAWHAIHNLSRPDEPPSGYWDVVGPICETGDVLGRDRLLPDTRPGDVLLIENAGAYGAVMASRYNLREPAAEVVLDL